LQGQTFKNEKTKHPIALGAWLIAPNQQKKFQERMDLT
jgi:hypothetical protein